MVSFGGLFSSEGAVIWGRGGKGWLSWEGAAIWGGAAVLAEGWLAAG